MGEVNEQWLPGKQFTPSHQVFKSFMCPRLIASYSLSLWIKPQTSWGDVLPWPPQATSARQFSSGHKRGLPQLSLSGNTLLKEICSYGFTLMLCALCIAPKRAYPNECRDWDAQAICRIWKKDTRSWRESVSQCLASWKAKRETFLILVLIIEDVWNWSGDCSSLVLLLRKAFVRFASLKGGYVICVVGRRHKAGNRGLGA